MSTSRSLPGQVWLIEFMQRAGYRSAITGICFGVAVMAAQALLLNDVGTFDMRFWQMFLAFQNTQLPTNDMLAVMDGIELNQQPWFYSALFGSAQALYQSTSLTMFHTQSKALGNQALKTESFSGAYSKSELRAYFSSLLNAIKSGEDQLDHPVTMILRNHDHAVTVAFDSSKNNWVLIDASGALTSVTFNNVDDITQAVHLAFRSSPTTIFSSTLLSTAQNANAVARLYQCWQVQQDFQDIHHITKDNVNVTDRDGASRLSMAVYTNDVALAQDLLAKGANPDQGSLEQGSPLMIAAMTGNVELAKLLIKAGANINLAGKNGQTALIVAAGCGQAGVVNLLLKSGAEHQTALYAAVAKGYAHVANIMLSAGVRPDVPSTKDNLTPLAYAAWNNDLESVRVLLQYQADVSKGRQSTGDSPLFFAAKEGFRDVVEMLLAHGADPLHQNNKGITPLKIADFCKKREIVSLMQEAIEQRNKVAEPPVAVSLTPVTKAKAGFFKRVFGKSHQQIQSPSQTNT